MRTFELVLTGKPLPGFDPGKVAAALAATLRIPEEKARELLAGRETVIKRGLTEEQVPPYSMALRKCGAEVRMREFVPVPDSMKCPACGADQPLQRNLCSRCGADMKRVAAAQEEAKSAPPEPAVVVASPAARATAAALSSLDAPLYRRTPFTEFLFFFFLTPYWAWKTMTDPERGTFAHFFGGVVLLAFIGQMIYIGKLIHTEVTAATEIFDVLREAGEARKQVEEFAVARRRFPERGELAVAVTSRAVESIEIGPHGRVHAVLAKHVRHGPGGALTLTPIVGEQGSLSWHCSTKGITMQQLEKHCEMEP